MKYALYIFLLVVVACQKNPSPKTILPATKTDALVQYVNPFIGTDAHGHTYPGATLPFGMMQLSPDTRLEGWDGCSGYHYSDSYIYGFSHTHLSGTGVSDYADVLIMPLKEVVFNNGADDQPGYKAPFSHDKETASPGYYAVFLDEINVQVELTVSYRSGMHRYHFPKGQKQMIIIDLEHRDQVLDSQLQLVSDTEISGYRHSKAWAEDQRLFFNIEFSKPYQKVTFLDQKTEGKNVKAIFEFDENDSPLLEIKVGISPVDEAGARLNRDTELADKSFEQIRQEATDIWEKQLEKIVIETENNDRKTIFYTALYHTMLAPNLFTDVDGRYRGLDQKIHSADFDYYTVFSLWDTFRATHPLYTLIEQSRTNDFVKTLLAKYDEYGVLPIWDLWANETGCMIGYHGVSVIVDAYMKGIRDFDINHAFEAITNSAMQDHLGLAAYKKIGYVPVEEESESVSKTLEYAYDDWTIATMAEALGKTEEAKKFYERAQYYKNVFDPETGFMRGRFQNTWFSPFDPYEVNFNYTEANAWQYSLFVPHDVSGLMELMGGKNFLENHLDRLFTAHTQTTGRDQADITGLIGQYAHGNEPSHHMAYLYNFVNRPDKTQERVHQILTQQYSNTPEGISGNEDCGQMSAWYVLSAMGFYSMTPGSNQYIIGTPLFPKATITIENGKHFTIAAPEVSDTNKYIKAVFLNGKPYSYSYLNHQDIVAGGTLFFEMTDSPQDWGQSDVAVPVTAIKNTPYLPAPFIASGDVAFKEQTTITLGHVDPEAQIYYRIDDSEYQLYQQPFVITAASVLHLYSKKGTLQSEELTTRFFKIDPQLSVVIETPYANQYSAGGDNALIDGIQGAKDFRTGAWQGYQNTDVVATVDLGRLQMVENVEMNFLQDQRSWIFYPTEVRCFISTDGTTFTELPPQSIKSHLPSDITDIITLSFEPKTSAQYVKIVAKNLGDLPEWHLGYPYQGKAWIFIDEIEITAHDLVNSD